jgi:hypothetical protein
VYLDLVGNNQFKDLATMQRAVGLLQYLATEDDTPPGYLLPLNKVLCGMDPAVVLDFGPPVSELEAAACTDLLTAVIAQAPILREMSIVEFRGAFLLRQGILSSRDVAWLLRVERGNLRRRLGPSGRIWSMDDEKRILHSSKAPANRS